MPILEQFMPPLFRAHLYGKEMRERRVQMYARPDVFDTNEILHRVASRRVARKMHFTRSHGLSAESTAADSLSRYRE